jgi:uncharacterized protein (DUF2336 family)
LVGGGKNLVEVTKRSAVPVRAPRRDALAQNGTSMLPATSLIAELDAALRSSASDRRIETLRRVTDLFLTNSVRLEPEQVALFDDVLGHMIGHVESRALAELGHRLAPVDNAPMDVIRRLAMHDEIEVAGPVLSTSNRLSGPDLVNIAMTKSQEHLLAISGRGVIEEEVTDVLVSRGNDAVARRVAGNEGARLSLTGYSKLVKRAESDEELADRVGSRSDVPPQLFRQLLLEATDAVRARLLAAMAPQAAQEVERALKKISDDMCPAAPARDYASALHLVNLMKRDRALGEKEILDFARTNRFEEVAAALSVTSSAPIDLVERLMEGSRIEALLIPCKAAGLSWPVAKAVMSLHPSHCRTSEETFAEIRRDFLRLSGPAAQRILRFWQVRSATEHERSSAGALN